MGCLASIAALMALVLPAAVARASLVGAYVLIVLLTAVAMAAVIWSMRRRAAARNAGPVRPTTAIVRIAIIAVVYAAVVTVEYVTR